MAKLLGDAGRLEEEAEVLDRVIAIDPYFINARTRRAANLVLRGRPGDAEAELRRLMDDVPGVAEVHHGLARVLLQERKTDEALTELREALRLRPGFPDALSDLVQVLAATGRAGEALDACREAVERRPDEAQPHLLLGGLLERQGQTDEAARSYAAAVEAAPESVEARRAYGMFLERSRGREAAVAYQREMLRRDPGLPGAHYLLSYALMREGRTAEAVAELRAELRGVPNFRLAVAALARILATDPDPAIRDGAEAVRWAERLVVLAPDDPTAFDTLAAAYASAERFEAAVTAEARAIELARLQPGAGSDRVERYRRRMEAYRSGRSIRSAPSRSKE
jgi:tetratricopeptide (TPR) repeat protein